MNDGLDIAAAQNRWWAEAQTHFCSMTFSNYAFLHLARPILMVGVWDE
jgi:hypothetical protein